MTEKAKKRPPRPASELPRDALDIQALWSDTGLGDGITDTCSPSVLIGKPRDFFRTHPDKEYRRRTEVYTHKPEGTIEEQYYIIAPAMQGQIPEARPCTLVTVVARDGSARLWPITFPKDGEKDNEAWRTARVAARNAIERWLKIVWVTRAYLTREAQPGYAPDPDFGKLPPFNDLVRTALGEHGIIRGSNHAIYRELFGMPKKLADKDERGDL
jgi:hypothetical protein